MSLDNPMEHYIISELPIKNIVQLQEFEKLLENEEMLATFVSYNKLFYNQFIPVRLMLCNK